MSKKYTPKEFVQALERAKGRVKAGGLGRVSQAGGFVVEAYAKLNVMRTFKKISGNLANTIQTTLVMNTPKRAETEVGPTAIYGRIQELGGVVVPVTAQKLHWVDENGKHHSADKVTLPPRPYMAPAIEEHVSEIVNAMAITLQNEVEGAL